MIYSFWETTAVSALFTTSRLATRALPTHRLIKFGHETHILLSVLLQTHIDLSAQHGQNAELALRLHKAVLYRRLYVSFIHFFVPNLPWVLNERRSSANEEASPFWCPFMLSVLIDFTNRVKLCTGCWPGPRRQGSDIFMAGLEVVAKLPVCYFAYDALRALTSCIRT